MIQATKDFEFRGTKYKKGDEVNLPGYLRKHLRKQGLAKQVDKVDLPEVFVEAGYDTKEKIANATDKELLDLKGVGKATLKKVR